MDEINIAGKTYIIISKFCELIGKNYNTIYMAVTRQYKKTRPLRYVKIGNQIFIDKSEIEEYKWPSVGKPRKNKETV